MDPTVVFLIALIFVALIFFILIRMLGVQVLVVHDGEQYVVSRFGRIDRILTPGPRIVFNGFEKVERKINAREQPNSVYLELLFIRGVPFGYTLNLWCRNDLLAATNGNQDAWRKMALFNDDERRGQVIEAVRETMARCLNDLSDREPVPVDAPFVEKLLPIFPGIEQNIKLLGELRAQLSTILPSLGVVVSQAQPITVQKIHIGKDLRHMFTLGRTVAQLRELDPGMSSDKMLRLFASIEGLDMSHMRELTLGQFAGDSSDIKIDEQSAVEVEHRLHQQRRPGRASAASTVRSAAEAPIPPEDDHITHDDLRVLKQVPRAAR